MQEVRRRIGTSYAWNQGYFGQKIGVAVLDSGIYPHKDFISGQNRIRVFKDFVDGRISPYDNNGHGTHIAGIIAGSGAASMGRYAGVAPQASLIVLKVLDGRGNGKAENVCRAIEWVVKNRQKFQIRILNISMGAKIKDKTWESRVLVDAVEYAWDHGLTVVAAAGNNGPEMMSITAPGSSRKVITVGVAPELVGNEIANMTGKQEMPFHSANIERAACPFSGRGPTEDCVCKPDIVAPGFRIYSCSNRPPELYTARTGSSMAAPIVAGGLALLLNKYPDMTNKDIKIRLRKSAVSLHMPKEYQGWGMFSIPNCLG